MAPLPLSRHLVRCQALWALADASRAHAQQDRTGAPRRFGWAGLVHAGYRRDALLATSSLAFRAYGVALGRQVRLEDVDGVQWEFLVDFLRPAAFGDKLALACSGLRRDGTRVLLFLGHDQLRRLPGPDGADIIHLDALPRG